MMRGIRVWGLHGDCMGVMGVTMLRKMDPVEPWHSSERPCPTSWAAMLWTKGFLRIQAGFMRLGTAETQISSPDQQNASNVA